MHILPSDFNKVKVVVVGDIMLDRYAWGHVRRISPEAPVPVVKLAHTSEALGGAGNVAGNLTALGCQATVIGLCGRDERAVSLKQLLAQKNVGNKLIEDESRPTITKTRIMADRQQVLRLDEEDPHNPSSQLLRKVKTHLAEELKHCHAVILSDYGKGLLTSRELIREIIETVRLKGLPVLVDPKGGQWERYQNATCITPNTAELEAAAGIPLDGDESLLISQARDLRQRLDLEYLLVTRSAQGMCVVGPEDDVTPIAAQAREVYDVSGAGDTVIATLAAALAAGADFVQAARMANTAAGIVVGKLGTQPILQSELATALHFNDKQQHFPFSAAKMTAKDAAVAKVQEWHNSGQRVVFTNGCFDLLHPGHISLLYQARAFGDRLVVGLNTDDSVRRLKGPERPILREQDRAAMLSALACVDLVVHFDEDTPLNLLEALKPDILVKGSDYKPEEVVGKSVVESYGGSVQLVELVKGYSTTQLTRKVISGSNKH
ncbi:MAG: bifunctional D-glycero-beta-D-manno-heptose-7-phosphate kinase/D-glycero-beta-D-manno-heptose 1-phosphate adenylyltransferase HldE [Desulfobacteraceae bacterium]|jgi:D-beta-D-heptose 7-phosphate kinase/D-beta-D-heptose 1-phosphate adenosyltransferase